MAALGYKRPMSNRGKLFRDGREEGDQVSLAACRGHSNADSRGSDTNNHEKPRDSLSYCQKIQDWMHYPINLYAGQDGNSVLRFQLLGR